jgi:hypothetical protein
MLQLAASAAAILFAKNALEMDVGGMVIDATWSVLTLTKAA